jgi:RNA polymerase sigma-70 factor, ECF subfamily
MRGTDVFTYRGCVDHNARQTQWATWMQAAISGDQAAYRLLLESLAGSLRAAARLRLLRAGCADVDAEDVVQETLLAIHLKRHTWRPAEPIGPWIAAISRNKLIDLLRRRGRRPELPLDDVLEAELEAVSEESGVSHDVERMLEGLDERQRRMVQLVSIEGRSAREAAGVLGMSEGALRVALHRCLKALAIQLKAERK